MGNAPAGQRTNFQTTITYDRPGGYAPFTHPSWHSSYSVIGIYDESQGGVSIGVEQPSAAPNRLTTQAIGRGNGEEEIRTPGTLAGTLVFETSPFSHSGTSPAEGRPLATFANFES